MHLTNVATMKTMTRPAALPVAPSSRQAALIAASLSANSRRAYRYAWESWLDWLGDEPASDATLSAYSAALHAAALRFAHPRGHPPQRTHPWVRTG